MKFLFQLHLHLLLITVPLSAICMLHMQILLQPLEQRQRCASFPPAPFWCHPTAPLHAHECSQFSPGYVHVHSYMGSPPLPACWLLLCSQIHGAQLNTCYFSSFFAYSDIGIQKKMKKMPKKAVSVQDLRQEQDLSQSTEIQQVFLRQHLSKEGRNHISGLSTRLSPLPLSPSTVGSIALGSSAQHAETRAPARTT